MNKMLIATLASGTLLIGACSADKTDFRAAAEKRIRQDVEENSGIEGDATADCDDPSSTDVGTTFACTATAGDKTSTFTYSAEITDDKTVTVSFIAAGQDEAGETPTSDESTPADGTETTIPGS